MHALPIALALLSAALLAGPLARMLAHGGHTRANYRARELPFPFGVLIPAAALLALIPLELVGRLASVKLFHAQALAVIVYCLGVLCLGLIDDLLAPGAGGDGQAGASGPRGWRGHAAALLSGRLSTGAVKAAGSLGLALLALGYLPLSQWRWLLAAAVLVLATNLFNLLDLRPGRAIKAFMLLGAGLALGTRELRPLWTLGLFAAPALVAGLYDLRERVMLGDTGASLIGGLAGLWLVLALSGTGQLVALALLLVASVYGELRPISALIDRAPGLRQLDSWGRPS